MNDEDKIKAEVTDLFSRASRKRSQPPLNITVGNGSVLVLGDRNDVGERRSTHEGRRKEDSDIREELELLRGQVKALNRLLDYLLFKT